jgi:hypothetical protein
MSPTLWNHDSAKVPRIGPDRKIIVSKFRQAFHINQPEWIRRFPASVAKGWHKIIPFSSSKIAFSSLAPKKSHTYRQWLKKLRNDCPKAMSDASLSISRISLFLSLFLYHTQVSLVRLFDYSSWTSAISRFYPCDRFTRYLCVRLELIENRWSDVRISIVSHRNDELR